MNDFWSSAEWERTWFRTQSREWRTLAIVPTETETSAPAFDMARAMVELGARHNQKLVLADFRRVPVARVTPFLQVAGFRVNDGDRLIYATRSIEENPATVPVARAADCVLLCVSLGNSSIRAIEDAIDQIGRNRFLGSVVFRRLPSTPSKEVALVRRESVEDVGIRE